MKEKESGGFHIKADECSFIRCSHVSCLGLMFRDRAPSPPNCRLLYKLLSYAESRSNVERCQVFFGNFCGLKTYFSNWTKRVGFIFKRSNDLGP